MKYGPREKKIGDAPAVPGQVNTTWTRGALLLDGATYHGAQKLIAGAPMLASWILGEGGGQRPLSF